MTITRVLVLGHSFIARLQQDIVRRKDPSLVPNFGLSHEGVRVRFLGFRGGNIDTLLSEKYRLIQSEISRYPPDMVILQIGGNDLDTKDDI